MNSGCVLECRDTPTSGLYPSLYYVHCICSYVYMSDFNRSLPAMKERLGTNSHLWCGSVSSTVHASAMLCISVSELVSCAFCTISICPLSIQGVFHSLIHVYKVREKVSTYVHNWCPLRDHNTLSSIHRQGCKLYSTDTAHSSHSWKSRIGCS